ncbi:MAG: hypothetical protein ACP5H8_03715 [Candidatus Micrarchaeia archaeon]
MLSFDELRRNAFELEKGAHRTVFVSVSEPTDMHPIEIRMLSYDFLLNELDKLYKIKAAKEYLTRGR